MQRPGNQLGETNVETVQKYEVNHLYPQQPALPPAYRGWKFVIITSVALGLLLLCGAYVAGIQKGKTMVEPVVYYVSSSGIVHNQNCKFSKTVDDAKNCEYCGGMKF